MLLQKKGWTTDSSRPESGSRVLTEFIISLFIIYYFSFVLFFFSFVFFLFFFPANWKFIWRTHFTASRKLCAFIGFYTVMFSFYFYRATSDKANKLESTVEIYRQKLQDLSDLRKQVKTLQETNMMYMKTCLNYLFMSCASTKIAWEKYWNKKGTQT